MNILVTGGAGYIGSHTCVELLLAGHNLVVIDNFVNSSAGALKHVEMIVGKSLRYINGDIRNKQDLCDIFDSQSIDAVVHFAGLKAVVESVGYPILYYSNNVSGSITLFETMGAYGIRNIIFSSSATVYGDTTTFPINESFPIGDVTNPYASSKVIIENILRDIHFSDPQWNIITLRYFNPVGAHPSGLIGEDPCGVPTNLLPYISQVAVGRIDHVKIYGNDYPTKDGTGIRDYIHVVDLAKGHLAAAEKLLMNPGLLTLNLGTGSGYSVLEMVHTFEKVSRIAIPYTIVERRPGDIACSYADPSLAQKILGWRAKKGIEEICEDAWRWQSMNPNGYKG